MKNKFSAIAGAVGVLAGIVVVLNFGLGFFEDESGNGSSTRNDGTGNDNPDDIVDDNTVICSISGKILDSETNKGLSNVQVSYFRFTQDPNQFIHEMKSKLATTGSDGSFSADCSHVETENFPLRIELSRSTWYFAGHQTNEFVRLGETNNLNIYVDDRFMSTPPP
jgi:hypothetical protein